MVIESYFINEGMKEVQIEEFLKNRFERAGYSHIEIQRTPLGTRIIVFVNRPGLVIGRSGRIIKEITDEIKEKFNLENPMLDVKEINNPFLDAQVVASRIANSIQRGSFYKKVVNYYLNEVMKNGAVGVQIKIAGKLGGERGRFQKFKMGYIKHAGHYADNILDKGYSEAVVKLGVIGVEVRIMKDIPEDLSVKISEINEKIKEESEKTEEESMLEDKEPEEKTEKTKKTNKEKKKKPKPKEKETKKSKTKETKKLSKKRKDTKKSKNKETKKTSKKKETKKTSKKKASVKKSKKKSTPKKKSKK
jgi:small subunit ribosomal protein S3